MSRTVIKREISRTLQTDRSDYVKITVGFQEEIEFSSDQEKKDKVRGLDQELIDEFVLVYNSAAKTLDVDRCLGIAEGKNVSKFDDLDMGDIDKDAVNAKNAITEDTEAEIDFNFEL